MSPEALAFGTTYFTSKYHLKFKIPIKRCLHLIFYRIGIMFKEKENTTLLTLSFFEWIKRVHNRVARRKIRLETNRTQFIMCNRIESMGDRKSTRLNSSHVSISYAVFCLKKKKKE